MQIVSLKLVNSFAMVVVLFSIGVFCSESNAQITQPLSEKKPSAIKLLDVGNVSRATFRREMKRFWRTYDPSVQLYIINYGTRGEIARREKVIVDLVAFRDFDRSRITLVRGGFGKGPRTVAWKVPYGADNPVA